MLSSDCIGNVCVHILHADTKEEKDKNKVAARCVVKISNLTRG